VPFLFADTIILNIDVRGYIMLALRYALKVFQNMDNFLKIDYTLGNWHFMLL